MFRLLGVKSENEGDERMKGRKEGANEETKERMNERKKLSITRSQLVLTFWILNGMFINFSFIIALRRQWIKNANNGQRFTEAKIQIWRIVSDKNMNIGAITINGQSLFVHFRFQFRAYSINSISYQFHFLSCFLMKIL